MAHGSQPRIGLRVLAVPYFWYVLIGTGSGRPGRGAHLLDRVHRLDRRISCPPSQSGLRIRQTPRSLGRSADDRLGSGRRSGRRGPAGGDRLAACWRVRCWSGSERWSWLVGGSASSKSAGSERPPPSPFTGRSLRSISSRPTSLPWLFGPPAWIAGVVGLIMYWYVGWQYLGTSGPSYAR